MPGTRITMIAAAMAAPIAMPVAASASPAAMNGIPSTTGFEQIREGRLDSAERIIVEQMRAHPDAPELALNLAAIYLRTGRQTLAAPLYARVLAEPAIAMDMPSGGIVSSHDVARRAAGMIAVANR